MRMGWGSKLAEILKDEDEEAEEAEEEEDDGEDAAARMDGGLALSGFRDLRRAMPSDVTSTDCGEHGGGHGVRREL